jgi:hypothetical protein
MTLTLTTPLRRIEDLSIGARQLLERHGLRTLGDVLGWTPPADASPYAIDNISALLEDLGYEWPSPAAGGDGA